MAIYQFKHYRPLFQKSERFCFFQSFLWLNDDNPKLSQKIREFCLSGEHSFYLSIASAWEIQIKVQLGKLSLTVPIEELVTKNQQENNIESLPIGLTAYFTARKITISSQRPV